MKRKVKSIKEFVSYVLVCSLLISCFSFMASYSLHATGSALSARNPSNPIYDEETDTTDWDYVYFGNYPQKSLSQNEITADIINADYNEDGDAIINGEKIRRMSRRDANYLSRIAAEGFFDWNIVGDEYVYFQYEPIKWRVLQNEGDTLLLLSDSVVDCQRYERSDSKITWESCSIRSWLNSTFPYSNIGWSFVNAAFSKEEQNAIVTSKLNNPANPFHGTNGGAVTEDKVFLLSVPEMTNEDYGFPNDYMKYSSSRQLAATDYAKAMGTWMGSHNELYDGNAVWMLRTPGSYQQTVSLVYWFGNVYQDGYYAETPYYGVAPAIRVDASSDLWSYVETDNEQFTRDNEIKSKQINNDFSVSDATEALCIALAIKNGTFDEIDRYDLNRDGEVILSEVTEILCIALGIKPYPQVSPANSPEPDETFPIVSTSPLPPLTPRPVPTLIPTPTPTNDPLIQKEYDPTGTIWIAGDSIADYHSKNGYTQPLYGWGEIFGDYFENNKTLKFTNNLKSDKLFLEKSKEEGYTTLICNTALSSRSSKSFTNENNYSSIINLMDEGDYLLISFGHNDERADVALYTNPFGSSSDERSFKWYLKTYYIDPAIRAGVQPVLISPVPRRYFYKGEFINPQLHTTYGKAMKELTEEYANMGINIYYIDLHSYMLDMYEELGEEGTIALHGKYGGTMDNTHLSQKGATIVSEYIVSKIKEQKMSIAKFIIN